MTAASVIETRILQQAGTVTVNLAPLMVMYGLACASPDVDPDELIKSLFEGTPIGTVDNAR